MCHLGDQRFVCLCCWFLFVFVCFFSRVQWNLFVVFIGFRSTDHRPKVEGKRGSSERLFKPQTAHEKSLAPKENRNKLTRIKYVREQPMGALSFCGFCIHVILHRRSYGLVNY